MLVACSSEKATFQDDESSNKIIIIDSPALNCCKTLEDEIIDLKINLALLQQQINTTGQEVVRNREDIATIHLDVDEVKEETLENSLRIGQIDDDIVQIHAILQKLNGKDSALEQEIAD